MLQSGRGVTIRPKEVKPTPSPAPGYGVLALHRAPVKAAPLPSDPFASGERTVQKTAARAQAREPVTPTPYIPRLKNPTPAQTSAALAIAHRSKLQAIGPNASPARERAYEQELLTDPRQAEYVATLRHYAKAAEGHAAELLGRITAGGGEGIEAARTPAAMRLTRGQAERLGRQRMTLAQPRADARAAPKDFKLPLAEIRIPGSAQLAQTVGSALASVTPGLQGNTPEESFARNIGKDALSVGELPFVGGLQAANAGVQAAQGNLKPGEKLASGIAQGLEHGAAGELVQGHLGAAENAVREHPLFSALEVLGASGVAGRTAGAVARGVGGDVTADGLRGALARAGSQVRPPVALTDDAGAASQGLVKERTYSPDLIRKAMQVLSDKKRGAVLDGEGNAVTLEQRGRQVPVLKPSDRDQERLAAKRANFVASRTQAGENVAREDVRRVVNKAESPGRSPLAAVKGTTAKELVHLVATGTIRSADTFKADLEKRAAVIEAAVQHPENFRTRKELEAAQANARLLRAAASNPKVLRQADAIVGTGLRVAGELNKGDARLAELDVHPQEELTRAALSEYALAHMGARHFTVEDHQALEREALAREHAAASTVADAQPGSPEHAAAVAGLQRARGERIAVSGRGLPENVVAHESKIRGAAAARKAVSDAQEAVSRAERVRARQVGVHSSRRASEGLRPATDAEKAQAALLGERVKSAKAELRAAKAEATRAAGEARASTLPPIKEALRYPDGRHLPNGDIREHARNAGRDPETLAYVPHVLEAGSKRAYHRQFRPGTRPAPASQARTGVLFNRGATAVSRDLVKDELTGKATTAHKAAALDRFAKETGLRRPDGRYFTPKEALEAASRFEADGETQYVPVRAFGAKLPAETRARLQEAQSPASMETAHLALLNDRVVTTGSTDGTRNVVLVPSHVFNALEQQLKPASDLEKTAQLLNAPFRMAVLPQPRWLTGNFIEPFFVRLPLSGAGVNLPGALMDVRAGSKALKAMEASGDEAQVAAAKEIRAQQFGGLFVGRRGASVRRTYQDFSGNEQRALYGAHVVRNLPVVKQLGDMVLSLPHAFFHINRVIEGAAQRQAFGKSVRGDIQAFTGKWSQTVLLGQKALSDVGKGLVGTASQQRFMDAQHELLGQYEGFGPKMRRAIQTVAPFLPWTLASARFVFWTLPVHHTVAFDALVKSAQSVQSEWEAQHSDVPPGTLKDAVVRKDGGLVDLERYTPFGATSPVVQGDLSNVTNTLLPQLSGAIKAVEGQDPFGRELQVPKTPGDPEGKATGAQKAEIAVNQLAEALVPLLAQGRRLQEGGGTAYANSTIVSPQVKPNTSHGMSALERTLSPFRPTYLKQPAATSGSASLTQSEQRALSRSEKTSAFDEQRLQRAVERSER